MIAGDTPRSPAATLVETAASRVLEQTGVAPRRAGFLGQLIDLGFPVHALRAGPVRRARHPGGHAHDRRRAAAGRVRRPRGAARARARLTGLGRAAQELIGSLDQGLELAQGTTSFVWVGDRIVRGWAIELVLIALLDPVPRRRASTSSRTAGGGASRLAPGRAQPAQPPRASGSSSGSRSTCFALLGAWPTGAPRPPNPATRRRRRLARARAARARPSSRSSAGSSRGSGSCRAGPSAPTSSSPAQTVALLALGVVALLVVATNPFALHLRAARRCTPGSGCRRCASGTAAGPRARSSRSGSSGRADRRAARSRVRFGLGFDAPWYLLELVALGYVQTTRDVAITLGGAACAAQLAAVAAGRYAPYPERRRAAGARADPRARPHGRADVPRAPAAPRAQSRGRRAARSDREVADRRACRQLAVAARHEHERVAAALRTIMCDSWPVSGSSTTASSLDPRSCARSELVAVLVAPHRRAEPARQVRRAGIARALQREQRRADEELEPDERRDGVARQPEDERRAAHRERDRLPGPDRDAPEDLLARRARRARRARGRAARPRRRPR